MANYPLTPVTRILQRMKAMVEAENLHEVFDVPTPFTVRHYRHRQAKKGEIPGIGLRLVANEKNPDSEAIHGGSEVCWKMTVDVVIDMELAPEKFDGSGEDETGWNALFAVANACTKLFVAEDSEIRMMVDDCLYGDTDPDEDTRADEGRLAASVIVLYRTLWNDPNHLFSSEENAP